MPEHVEINSHTGVSEKELRMRANQMKTRMAGPQSKVQKLSKTGNNKKGKK